MNKQDRTIKQGTGESNWLIYQSKFLFKNQLCHRCSDFNLDNESSAIWHIEPVNGFDDLLYWEPSNHLAVCCKCYATLSKHRANLRSCSHKSANVFTYARYKRYG